MTDKQLFSKIKIAFEDRFNKLPIFIAAPGRINLIGEHTDYNNGFVFPASIDKYIIGAFSKTNEKFSNIYAIDLDEEIKIDLKKISKQTAGKWENYVLGVINELFKRGREIDNFNLVFGGSIPLGAGLSSSAALENCIVYGLNELFELNLDKEEMIQISLEAEHNFAGVNCGIMDQFASMRGREDHAIFLDCADLSYDYVPIKTDDYQLVLINTNIKHSLADSAYNKRKDECSEGVKILQKEFPVAKSLRDVSLDQLMGLRNLIPQNIYKRCLFVLEENERVKSAKRAIMENKWEIFGELLFKSHEGLQYLYEVSCEELDFLVERAKDHKGVIGSRMMGGGFGGCTLNLIKKANVEEFTEQVVKDYKNKFGIKADIYLVNISSGTRRIKTIV